MSHLRTIGTKRAQNKCNGCRYSGRKRSFVARAVPTIGGLPRQSLLYD